MSRVLENDAKGLLSRFGVAVPPSIVIDRLPAADVCEAELGYPMIVKVLVPSGRKAKGGGIRTAGNREELQRAVAALLGASVHGYVADRLLVERFVHVERELFLSISYDAIHRGPRLLFGACGGVDVEQGHDADGIFSRVFVSPLAGLGDEAIRCGWQAVGFDGPGVGSLVSVTRAAWDLWTACDATFLEINPLGLMANGETCALGALLRLDDDALYRHPELVPFTDPGNDRSWKTLSERERAVLAADALEPYRGTIRYTDMPEGDIGTCGVGGGGSLVTYDLLVNYGLRPANYAEMGGNPSATKVHALDRHDSVTTWPASAADQLGNHQQHADRRSRARHRERLARATDRSGQVSDGDPPGGPARPRGDAPDHRGRIRVPGRGCQHGRCGGAAGGPVAA